MLDLITYILTFVIIAFVLMSAVIVHLHLGFHRRIVLKRKMVKSGGKASPTLHKTIFQGKKIIKPDDGTSSTLNTSGFFVLSHP